MPIERYPNDYVVALLDLWPGLYASLPPDERLDSPKKPIVFTGGHIASAVRLSFRSSSDYVLDPKIGASRIMKVMLANNGYATAHHIRIGIGFPEGTGNWKIMRSPNLKLTEHAVPQSGINNPYIDAEIDRLGGDEKALLTITYDWLFEPSEQTSVATPYIPINSSPEYTPILYLTSDEGTGEVLSATSWADAEKWEQSTFPYSSTGYWASRIRA